MKKVEDYIKGKVHYDNEAQVIYCDQGIKAYQIVADVRGWGAIQNLFINNDGEVDFEKAYKFQDEVGEWIADAINGKLLKPTNQ